MPLRRFCLFFFVVCSIASGASLRGNAQTEAAPALEYSRPNYQLNLTLDYQLLTFSASGKISVPVAPNESLKEAVFFIYANAPGVSGNDASHSNIVVDEVKMEGAALEYSLKGAVLRVQLPAVRSKNFALDMKWRGVVPRAPAGSGGLMDAMGGMDLSSIFGGGLGGAEKKKDPDYGVYSYGNGVLSLGSFWYPSLAVRQNGKWMDEAPGGVGDVGFSEVSDFSVNIPQVKSKALIAVPGFASGSGASDPLNNRWWSVERCSIAGIRDFAVFASDQFIIESKHVQIGDKRIFVSAYLTKANAAKADQVLDIATNALQIYSKRFGPYPYDSFKVVEGPMRGGAGGMEFSGLVSIASFLFSDMDAEMKKLAGALGGGDLEKMMGGLFPEDAGGNANPAAEMLGGMLGQQKATLETLLEVTVAHEVAHQWWAMGVGSDAQRAPWVDESLTNYSAMIYFEDRYGKAKAAEMMEMHLKGTYSAGRMLGGADAPANLGSGDYKSSMQYGAIVYGKGALFYDALRKLVGDEKFFAATRAYFQKYNGKLAPARGLLEIVKMQSPEKANEIEILFKRWIEEAHGDEDITGGKVAGMDELLGGLLGGMAGAMEE